MCSVRSSPCNSIISTFNIHLLSFLIQSYSEPSAQSFYIMHIKFSSSKFYYWLIIFANTALMSSTYVPRSCVNVTRFKHGLCRDVHGFIHQTLTLCVTYRPTKENSIRCVKLIGCYRINKNRRVQGNDLNFGWLTSYTLQCLATLESENSTLGNRLFHMEPTD
jgi:hypothetical protein